MTVIQFPTRHQQEPIDLEAFRKRAFLEHVNDNRRAQSGWSAVSALLVVGVAIAISLLARQP